MLIALDFLEGYLKTFKPEIDNKEEIMKKIVFYSIFLIIIAPILEEVLYRLPLKKYLSTSFTLFSLLIGVIYILIFDLLLIKIALAVYLAYIIYLSYSKKEIPNIFIVLSVFVFTISHIGNYNLLDVQSMSSLDLLFLFLPQLIFGIIVTFIRIKYSFKYALLYHILYNSIIIILAINVD